MAKEILGQERGWVFVLFVCVCVVFACLFVYWVFSPEKCFCGLWGKKVFNLSGIILKKHFHWVLLLVVK